MVGLAIVCAAILITGAGIARWLFARSEGEAPSPLDLTFAGGVIGAGIWIGVSWILALTHSLMLVPVLALSAAFIVAAVVLRPRVLRWPSLPTLAVLAPVALWFAYVLGRGVLLPPVNHDALAYHLPKAVLFMRAAGLPDFAGYDHRFASFPANYELLVSELMIVSGSDRLSEWIAVAFFALFLLAAAAFACRWWGTGTPVAAAVLVTAAAPVVLIHAGADKNDLMTQFFILAALYWGARWVGRGGVIAMVLTIAAGALAVGTKITAAPVALGLAPFILARAFRQRPPFKALAATAVFSAIAFLLFGGAIYVTAAQSGAPMGVRVGGQSIGTPLFSVAKWEQMWMLPLQTFAAGIDPTSDARHILFSSHFGPLPTLLVLALPLAIRRYAGIGDENARRERNVASLVALLTFALMLPTGVHPPALPRYALFALVFIIAWTVAPALREMSGGRLRRYATFVVTLLIIVFAQQAADMAIHDASANLEFVRRQMRDPGNREPPHTHPHASLILDRLAGPNDTIAFQGDASAWIHPAYGARLTRPVLPMPAPATLEAIPSAADWVVIERWWLNPGDRPSSLQNDLAHDGRFKAVFADNRYEQWVYQRISK